MNWQSRAELNRTVEIVLIALGLLILTFYVPHTIEGDGEVRFRTLSTLLSEGKLSNSYPYIGPLFSAPLWFMGKLYESPEWWCRRYNVLVFALGLLGFYFLLRKQMEISTLRKFLLILIFGSMFPGHVRGYYAETFITMFVSLGILGICVYRSFWGWVAVLIGTLNAAATVVGLCLVTLGPSLTQKKWRYLLLPLVYLLLFLAENWLVRGSPFLTDYERNRGYCAIRLIWTVNPVLTGQ